jgi:hypothetical protein
MDSSQYHISHIDISVYDICQLVFGKRGIRGQIVCMGSLELTTEWLVDRTSEYEIRVPGSKVS